MTKRLMINGGRDRKRKTKLGRKLSTGSKTINQKNGKIEREKRRRG